MTHHKTLAVCLSGLLLVVGSAGPLRADELSDAIAKRQQLEQQRNQNRSLLNQLTFSADKIKRQIDNLNSQIVQTTADLSQKQAAYRQAQQAVSESEAVLAEKQHQLDQRRAALRQRVRGIYENGQISYLEVLFDSSDLEDFVTRVEYLSHLVANDRQLLNNIQTVKEQVTKKTEELKQRRDQAAALQVQAAKAKSDLDGKKSELQIAMNQNKQQQQELFDDITKSEADSKALADKIRGLQAARKGGVIGTITTWPLPGHYEISSPFGWRTHPVTGEKKLHTGIDIPAPAGTEIRAAGAGVVIFAGWYGSYGNSIIIDHGGGISTLYAHQSKFAVQVNEQVKANQVIGNVGSTGLSTGPHLHFEVRVGGNPTDPLQYFN